MLSNPVALIPKWRRLRPALLFSSLLLSPLLVVAEAPLSLLNVEGRGEVKVAPEIARLSFGIEAEATTAAAAQRQVTATRQKLLQQLQQQRIDASALQTVALELLPRYREVAEQASRISGYLARHRLELTIADHRDSAALLDRLMAAGVNTISGIRFELRDPSAAQAAALSAAVVEAQRKAEAMSRALGVRLGPVLQLDERHTSMQPQPLFRETRLLAAAASAPVPASDVTVSASVAIRYQLLPSQ